MGRYPSDHSPVRDEARVRICRTERTHESEGCPDRARHRHLAEYGRESEDENKFWPVFVEVSRECWHERSILVILSAMRLTTRLILALCAPLTAGRGKGGECDAEDHDKRVCDNNNKCICSSGDRRLSHNNWTDHAAPTSAPTATGRHYYYVPPERDCQCQTKLQGWQIGLIVAGALLVIGCWLVSGCREGGGERGGGAKVGEERRSGGDRAEAGEGMRSAEPMVAGTVIGYEAAAMATPVVVVDGTPIVAGAPPQEEPRSMADELKKLADMRQDGLLTEAEFGTAKAKLLSSL